MVPPMLDPATTSRLADLDPVLSLVADAFPPASSRARRELHDVRWTPGEGCQLAYRVEAPDTSPRFEAVTLGPAGWSRHVHTEDPLLPGLRAASDPATVGRLLGTALGRPVRRLRVRPVRYRPGRRCVLRYDLETDGPVAVCYAKVFRPETFTRVAAQTAAVAGSPAGTPLTPPLLATWPDLQTLVTAAVDGRGAGTELADPRLAEARRARLAHRLGELLGAFHGLAGVEAPRMSAADQLRSVRTAALALRHVDPGLGARLDLLLDRLAASAPPDGPDVLTHGGFRAGQVVVCHGGELRLLDLDGLCAADRARDLATALAQLFWLGVRRPEHRAVRPAIERGLLSGYEHRAGPLDRDTLRWWRAAALLQVAVRRYRRLEIADWPSVPALVDRAAELVAEYEANRGSGARADLPDVERMSSLLLQVLGQRSTSGGPLVIETGERLAVAHGRRVVARYGVRGLNGQGAGAVVGKAFTDPRRADLLYQRLRLLHDGPFGTGRLRVPEPLGILPDHRLVLFRHCDGVALERVDEPARAAEGVRLAARWLARLHRSGLRLPRSYSVDEEARSTREWATLIGRTYPDLAGRAVLIAKRWPAVARPVAVDVQVPIHKDFHPGHVLVGEKLYVVDLDESRQGDPAFDLAHFRTYLAASYRLGRQASLRAAFLEEYVAATGWRDTGSYRPFCAYTWLKIAKQLAVGSGPVRVPSPSARRSAAEHAIAEAERCLDG
jgi:aminoglycoside phosphotransferase (APT) family kinase protein